jgi:hypothetical protein
VYIYLYEYLNIYVYVFCDTSRCNLLSKHHHQGATYGLGQGYHCLADEGKYMYIYVYICIYIKVCIYAYTHMNIYVSK